MTNATISVQSPNKNAGVMAGILGCIFAVLGILFLGVIFVPIAFVITCCGMFIAVKHRNSAGIGLNSLSALLTIIGFFTSPILMFTLLGIADASL